MPKYLLNTKNIYLYEQTCDERATNEWVAGAGLLLGEVAGAHYVFYGKSQGI